MENSNKYICRLCGNTFSDKEMSEEHYPAKSVGNNDIVLLDVAKMLDDLSLPEFHENIARKVSQQRRLEDIIYENFEKCVVKDLYPIIKAIYAKFLLVPEAINEKFDFINFIRNSETNTYS